MAMVPPGVRSGAWAAGSDAPEKKEVRIGFIPLTDCASVVMAAVNKFDEKYGIKIIPTKEASWASVRDKLVNGELDAAHVLYGLIYGVQLGVGGPKKDMNVLMALNNNGQAITLSNQLKDKGAIDGASLRSTTGQVQVIASGDIRTSTADGSTPEISTAGNALLVAGGAIGNEGRRIELSGVTTLATQSADTQWLSHGGGNLALGALTGVNAGPVLGGLQATGAGSDISLRTQGGSLALDQGVSIAGGTGTVTLESAGAISQAADASARILADKARVVAAAGSARLDNSRAPA